jgi:hypothetical protein
MHFCSIIKRNSNLNGFLWARFYALDINFREDLFMRSISELILIDAAGEDALLVIVHDFIDFCLRSFNSKCLFPPSNMSLKSLPRAENYTISNTIAFPPESTERELNLTKLHCDAAQSIQLQSVHSLTYIFDSLLYQLAGARVYDLKCLLEKSFVSPQKKLLFRRVRRTSPFPSLSRGCRECHGKNMN